MIFIQILGKLKVHKPDMLFYSINRSFVERKQGMQLLWLRIIERDDGSMLFSLCICRSSIIFYIFTTLVKRSSFVYLIFFLLILKHQVDGYMMQKIEDGDKNNQLMSLVQGNHCHFLRIIFYLIFLVFLIFKYTRVSR